MRKLVYFCLAIAMVANSRADLIDIFKHKSENDEMAFENDRVPGECMGFAEFQQAFSDVRARPQFRASASPDTGYVLEAKLRAFLNGQAYRGVPVVFNGYKNLRKMSVAFGNKKLFRSLISEIQRTYKHTRDRYYASHSNQIDPAAEVAYLKEIIADLSARPKHTHVLQIMPPSGGVEGHAITAISVKDYGDHYIFKIIDPNFRNVRDLRLNKDAAGNFGNVASYASYGGTVLFNSATENPYGHLTYLSLTPRYFNDSASYPPTTPSSTH